MYDPVGDSPTVEQVSLSPRDVDLAGVRIGLLHNGKPAATPTLTVVEDHLRKAYPDSGIDRYEVDHLNRLKNDDVLDEIETWASEETDVCIGALGDCGSCTKLLVYAVNAVERGGTPAIGLIDQGFEIDWRSNRQDFGRELRYFALPPLAEVTDEDRIRELLTREVFDEILTELTRERTGNELAEAADDSATVGPEE